MKHRLLTVAALTAGALLGPLRAGAADAGRPLRLELSLTDGSYIIGTPAVSALPVQTAYASMELPLVQLVALTSGDDRETVTLDLQNGDKLQGIIKLAAIKLDTAFGRVTVGREHWRELRVLLPGQALSEALKQGLVLDFAFDRDEEGKVPDRSGKGNHGQVFGARYTAEGKHGGACSLSGSQEHVTVPNSASLEIRTQLTVAVWIKLGSLGPGGYGNEHGYIVNKGDDLWWNPTFCLGYAKSGEPLFHVCNATDPQNGGGRSAVGVEKLKPGAWVHLAGVYDGAAVKLYVNGRLAKTEPYRGLLRADKAPVHLGGGKLFGTDWGNHFTVHGVLDDVMIFNRALTAREVGQLCAAQP